MTRETPTLRRAARVLLLDEDRRVLLVRLAYRRKRWWAAPGGGLEDDETHETAARREVAEEMGYELDKLGPWVWRREDVFRFEGRLYRQRERYFIASVPAWIVDPPARRPRWPVDVVFGHLVGPRLHEGIATFESDTTARTQRPADGDEHRVPGLIVEEELGHVAGHDRKVGLKFAQAKRVPLDPFHPSAASPAPGNLEHRLRRLDADQPVAASGQLAGQQPGTTPYVDDRRCRELRREIQIERLVLGDGIYRVVDRDQSGIVELVEIRCVGLSTLFVHRSRV
jgi:8-oxo-dGTP pyrophosphatase MutT (NUDIX family)